LLVRLRLLGWYVLFMTCSDFSGCEIRQKMFLRSQPGDKKSGKEGKFLAGQN
jgi:hypothetical protein